MTIFHSRTAWRLAVTLIAAAAAFYAPGQAGEADIVKAEVQRSSDGTYSFDVTVSHADEGWVHYADAFEILTLDGEILDTRVLLHPHENEQPFTRSLTGVGVDTGLTEVRARAHDNVHGYGGVELVVELPSR